MTPQLFIFYCLVTHTSGILACSLMPCSVLLDVYGLHTEIVFFLKNQKES